MNSLQAFLSPCVIINAESELRDGVLTVLVQNERPTRFFDTAGQSRHFTIMLVTDPKLLTEGEVATLATIVEQSVPILIVDYAKHVRGVIEAHTLEDLRVTATAGIKQGEFGSRFSPPLPPLTRVGTSRSDLREWWHQIIREYESNYRYHCYAFFLCSQPSPKATLDQEAIKYLTTYGKEIDRFSDNNCLVLALTKTGYRRSGYDEVVWNIAISEQASEGYSVKIAQILKIDFSAFPCVVFFGDIRSPSRVIFSFKGLETEEIAKQMRDFFDAIKRAVSSGQKPITYLERYKWTDQVNMVSQKAFRKLGGFTHATAEAALIAWLKSR